MYKNGISRVFPLPYPPSFNPCFNGSMYKNRDGDKEWRDDNPFQSLF